MTLATAFPDGAAMQPGAGPPLGPACLPSRRAESGKGEEVSPGGAETGMGTGLRAQPCPGGWGCALSPCGAATQMSCPVPHEGGTTLPFVRGGESH